MEWPKVEPAMFECGRCHDKLYLRKRSDNIRIRKFRSTGKTLWVSLVCERCEELRTTKLKKRTDVRDSNGQIY